MTWLIYSNKRPLCNIHSYELQFLSQHYDSAPLPLLAHNGVPTNASVTCRLCPHKTNEQWGLTSPSKALI